MLNRKLVKDDRVKLNECGWEDLPRLSKEEAVVAMNVLTIEQVDDMPLTDSPQDQDVTFKELPYKISSSVFGLDHA